MKSSSRSHILKAHNLKPQTVVIGREAGAAMAADEPPAPKAASPEELIQQAQGQAAATLEGAAAELQALREQAYREGYLAGHATGVEGAHREMAPFLEKLAGLASQAQVDYARLVKGAEEAVVKLALAVAEKLVHKEISQDRSLVVAVVREALESNVARSVVCLRLNPDDVETVRNFWAAAYPAGSPLASVEIAADLRVSPSGCMLETSTGLIDARVETRLAEISRAFTRLEQEENL